MITNYIATSRYRGSGPQPIVIRGPSGGGVRGGPFHSQNPEMAFFHTPGLKIVYPSTAYDAKGLIKAAIRDDDPVLFFEHKWLYRRPQLREVLPEEDYVVPLGEARIHREGTDLTIVTYAAMVHKSLDAASRLHDEDGMSVEVLDLRTLLPLDEEAIVRSVKKTNRLLIVHEDTRTGGIAGEITMRVNEKAFEWLDAPILRVTAIDAPVPYSPPLEDFFLPQVEDILTAARYLARY
jgi:pyruvate/2-oxoglutarate/acetoin dehydrogenase E1 component